MDEIPKKYQWEQQKRIKKNKKNKILSFIKLFYFLQNIYFTSKRLFLFQKITFLLIIFSFVSYFYFLIHEKTSCVHFGTINTKSTLGKLEMENMEINPRTPK